MPGIVIECATCQEKIGLEVSRIPQFGFELFDIASKADWFPVMDMGHSRVVVFCCDDCYKKQLTKKGTLRARLLKIPKEDRSENTCCM